MPANSQQLSAGGFKKENQIETETFKCTTNKIVINIVRLRTTSDLILFHPDLGFVAERNKEVLFKFVAILYFYPTTTKTRKHSFALLIDHLYLIIISQMKIHKR